MAETQENIADETKVENQTTTTEQTATAATTETKVEETATAADTENTTTEAKVENTEIKTEEAAVIAEAPKKTFEELAKEHGFESDLESRGQCHPAQFSRCR